MAAPPSKPTPLQTLSALFPVLRIGAIVLISACAGAGAYLLYRRATTPRPQAPSASTVRPAPAAPTVAVLVKPPADDLPEKQDDTKPSPDEPKKKTESDTKSSETIPLEDLVARVGPAVVAIETSSGRGSGFFVEKDTIVTNAHVAGTDLSVRIRRASGDTVSARVDRVAADLDLAILKLSYPIADQTVVELGQMTRVRAGEEVVAIGSPLGVFQNSVTRGIVSAVRPSGALTLIQTDAAINPGNSGGPLMDRSGVVIGINTMGVRNAQGISFAVGVDHARELLSGLHVATTDRTPIRELNDSLQSTPVNDADAVRARATRAYDAALATLSTRADQLDGYWRRFKTDCYEGNVGGGYDREWFSVFERDKLHGVVSPGCTGALSTVLNEANNIKRSVVVAEEAARRADVYPGVRRDLRRRYHLDYAGWDR
jgi:S1-C subfamily serine protease